MFLLAQIVVSLVITIQVVIFLWTRIGAAPQEPRLEEAIITKMRAVLPTKPMRLAIPKDRVMEREIRTNIVPKAVSMQMRDAEIATMPMIRMIIVENYWAKEPIQMQCAAMHILSVLIQMITARMLAIMTKDVANTQVPGVLRLILTRDAIPALLIRIRIALVKAPMPIVIQMAKTPQLQTNTAEQPQKITIRRANNILTLTSLALRIQVMIWTKAAGD